MSKKRKLPFGWLPGHWGLTGKTKEVARAEWELEGEELERRIVEINVANRSDKEVSVALLELDKKYGRIDESEFDKKKALVLDKPFVHVAKIETDPSNPAFGGIILDWNEAFVAHLEEHGYGPHPSAEETVDQWFNELCKNIALEAFDGLGDFTERMNESAMKPRRGISDDVIIPTRHPRDTDDDA